MVSWRFIFTAIHCRHAIISPDLQSSLLRQAGISRRHSYPRVSWSDLEALQLSAGMTKAWQGCFSKDDFSKPSGTHFCGDGGSNCVLGDAEDFKEKPLQEQDPAAEAVTIPTAPVICSLFRATGVITPDFDGWNRRRQACHECLVRVTGTFD